MNTALKLKNCANLPSRLAIKRQKEMEVSQCQKSYLAMMKRLL